ncbi:MAG: cytochrome c nitrite reductase small subunit [Bacteroidota bacterium]|nr:cytochrome c nitrite reductase small subunit [Bacteroidota bacterium]
MTKLVRFLTPPDSWRLPVIIILAAFAGLGGLVLRVSEAPSYLSDKPETCMNCHVMAPQYTTWRKGSHGKAATCNDCHVPHGNILATYLFKAQDGLRHAAVFTARAEPQVIRIRAAGKAVVRKNCMRCHAALIHDVSLAEGETDCLHCHREVPHGRVNGLASVPSAPVPRIPEITVSLFHRKGKGGGQTGMPW